MSTEFEGKLTHYVGFEDGGFVILDDLAVSEISGLELDETDIEYRTPRLCPKHYLDYRKRMDRKRREIDCFISSLIFRKFDLSLKNKLTVAYENFNKSQRYEQIIDSLLLDEDNRISFCIDSYSINKSIGEIYE